MESSSLSKAAEACEKATDYDANLTILFAGRVHRMGQYRGEKRKYRFLCYDCLGTWKNTLDGALTTEHVCSPKPRKGVRVEEIEGVSIKARGYEHHALRWLVAHTSLSMQDIRTETSGEIPVVAFTLGRRKKFYYPDLWVPKHNRIIEVKGLHTLGLKTGRDWRKNQLKARAVKDAGYEFTLLLIDKGQRVWLPKEWFTMSRQAVLQAMKDRENVC